MKKALIMIGSFIGAIAGIVTIKMLDLPVLVTILLVAALVLSIMVIIAKQMGSGKSENKTVSDKEQATSEKA